MDLSSSMKRHDYRYCQNVYNLGGEGKQHKQGYRGSAEYFGIYSSDTRKVYLVPVAICPIGDTSLRLEPTGKQGKISSVQEYAGPEIMKFNSKKQEVRQIVA